MEFKEFIKKYFYWFSYILLFILSLCIMFAPIPLAIILATFVNEMCLCLIVLMILTIPLGLFMFLKLIEKVLDD